MKNKNKWNDKRDERWKMCGFAAKVGVKMCSFTPPYSKRGFEAPGEISCYKCLETGRLSSRKEDSSADLAYVYGFPVDGSLSDRGERSWLQAKEMGGGKNRANL